MLEYQTIKEDVFSTTVTATLARGVTRSVIEEN